MTMQDARQSPTPASNTSLADHSEEEALLRERARRRAIPKEFAEQVPAKEILMFQLNQERYGVETRFVRRVFQPQTIAAVPKTADFFRGVTNLRGDVLGVMDLSVILGGDRVQPRWLLVLGEDRPEFGFAATNVFEVVSVRSDEIHAPSGSRDHDASDWILGVTREAVTILDGGKILNDPRLYIDET